MLGVRYDRAVPVIPTSRRTSDQFVYVALRLDVRHDHPCDLTGVVERLGAGEKRQFRDAAELLAFLRDWSGGLQDPDDGAHA